MSSALFGHPRLRLKALGVVTVLVRSRECLRRDELLKWAVAPSKGAARHGHHYCFFAFGVDLSRFFGAVRVFALLCDAAEFALAGRRVGWEARDGGEPFLPES